MPESNEIMSVSGQLVGLPLAGPESVTPQQLDYLKRALGVDETVLYEDNNPSQIISNTSLTLSESYLNFDKVKIYLRSSAGYDGKCSYIVESSVYQSDNTEVSSVPVSNARDNIYFDSNIFIFDTTAPTTCYVKSTGVRIYISPSSVSSTPSRGTYIYKIVGIHRISGGN